MIEKEPFLAGLAVLAGAFGREIDGPVQRAYYTVLNPQLSTEEFERSVSIALATETYWPSPAVLIGKVKSTDHAAGLLALEHVNRVLSAAGGHRFLPHERFHREFDVPTRAAIAAVGGLSEIAGCSVERHAAMAKRFAAAYTQSLAAPKQIAAPLPDGRVKTLVGSVVRNLSLVSGRDRATGKDE